VFIGNTAENIINSLECPILAVKPEGFESPLLRG
jgi:nucleotide-binding universal stress UspA family protein